MSHKCETCHDTGSISKDIAGQWDCTSCETPTERVGLEMWLQQFMPVDGNVAWAIHQRALAIGMSASVEDTLNEMQPGGALHMPQEPVAHLKYWAAQRWSGCGDHEIEHGEGLEVCEPGEIGADGQPAFPVFLHAIPGALAMAPKQEAPKSMAFIGLANSDQFKYVLEQLATGQPNPKERRRLVREVRDAIKLCAASQIKESTESFSARDWIKVEDRLPEPYEEVRILFDGVPRIARLCHNRQYFQLATFIDSTKSQYIAIFDKVDGWMPIALAPANSAAPAAANGALTDEQINWHAKNIYGTAATAQEIEFANAILAAAGPDAATNVEALRDILLGVIPAKMAEKHGRDFFQGEGQDEHRAEVKGFNACRDEVYDKANKAFQAALSGAKGN